MQTQNQNNAFFFDLSAFKNIFFKLITNHMIVRKNFLKVATKTVEV